MLTQILIILDVISIFAFSVVLLVGGIRMSIRAIKNWSDKYYQADIVIGGLFIFLFIVFVALDLKIVSIYF